MTASFDRVYLYDILCVNYPLPVGAPFEYLLGYPITVTENKFAIPDECVHNKLAYDLFQTQIDVSSSKRVTRLYVV